MPLGQPPSHGPISDQCQIDAIHAAAHRQQLVYTLREQSVHDGRTHKNKKRSITFKNLRFEHLYKIQILE